MGIENLIELVEDNTTQLGRATEEPDAIDVVHFKVVCRPKCTKEEFLKAVDENREGCFGYLNPFDGRSHDYIEVGGWIGDQGLAMQFMALSKYFGLVSLKTPQTEMERMGGLKSTIPSSVEARMLNDYPAIEALTPRR